MQATQIAYLAALIAVCVYAGARGGPAERFAVIAILVGSVASRLVEDTTNWGSPQLRILLIDLALMFALLWLVVRTRRLWPLFTAGFHFVGLVMHLAMAADRAVWPWAYFTAMTAFGYLMLASIAWGIRTRNAAPTR